MCLKGLNSIYKIFKRFQEFQDFWALNTDLNSLNWSIFSISTFNSNEKSKLLNFRVVFPKESVREK